MQTFKSAITYTHTDTLSGTGHTWIYCWIDTKLCLFHMWTIQPVEDGKFPKPFLQQLQFGTYTNYNNKTWSWMPKTESNLCACEWVHKFGTAKVFVCGFSGRGPAKGQSSMGHFFFHSRMFKVNVCKWWACIHNSEFTSIQFSIQYLFQTCEIK